MRGARRIAILASLSLLAGGCEALVGITDRELARDAGMGVGTSSGGGPNDGPSGSSGGEGDDGPTSPAGEGSGPETSSSSSGGATDTSTSSEQPGSSGGGDAGNTTPDVMSSGDAADTGSAVDPDLPCAMQPAFIYCNDFDSVTSVGQTWNWDYTNYPEAGTTFQFDMTDYRSPPNSAKGTLPPVTGNFIGNLQLGKDVGVLNVNVRLAFDFRLDVTSTTNMPQFGLAQILPSKTSTSAPMQVNYIIGPGAASQLQVYPNTADGGAAKTINLGAPPLQTWTRVGLEYDATGTVTVSHNGQLAGTITVGTGSPGDVVFIVGGVYINSSGTAPVTLELDNVVVTGR
jgi:hypothetical protein